MKKSEWIESCRMYFKTVKMSDEDRQQADSLLARIEEMVAECSTEDEFGEKFSSSPLALEYGQLVSRITNSDNGGGLNLPSQRDVMKEQMKKMPGNMAKGYAETRVRDTINSEVNRMLPDEVQQIRNFGIRDIPLIGTLFSWMKQIDFLRRLFCKRNEKE